MPNILEQKLTQLKQILIETGKNGLCIAFSGGVDSTLLLKTAAMLPIKVIAVTFSSRLSPKTELEEARELALSFGVEHHFLTFDEFTDERIVLNPPDRCYHCKKFIFSSLKAYCEQHGIGAVADGTNADDLSEYRPGLRALRELNILSPLAQCGFQKSEVREAARALELTVHSKPSAPCLATRVPYGTRLTNALLSQIELSESALKALGFSRCRVRAHGDTARIEVPPEDFGSLLAHRAEIITSLKEAGFIYVTLDIEGFRSGSMDIPLKKQPN